ncbi:WD40 repeat domain-containing protein [Nitratifractor sp.]
MRTLLALLCVLTVLGAGTLTPVRQIEADGAVNDLVIRDGALLMGTDHGSLQRLDLKTLRLETLFHLPQITDFMGDKIDDKVFSVDGIDGRYLILSDSGKGGFSDLRILEGGKATRIFGAADRHTIIKARFIDKDHILYATLGNEAVLYEIPTKKEIYRRKIGGSKFSDFALDAARRRAVFGDESGVVSVLDTKTGKILQTIEGVHVDNVFSVDIRKDWVVAGGQDRRASYANLATGEKGYFKSDFLVYAAALSPDARLAAYAMHADNSITVYDLGTRSPRYLLKGQKSILTRIVFEDGKTLFSASHDPVVMMWKLP